MLGPSLDFFSDLRSLFRLLLPVIFCLAVFSVVAVLILNFVAPFSIFKNGSSPLAPSSESNQGADESPLKKGAGNGS